MTDFHHDCRLYIQLHAKHARLKARMDVLKERIVPELEKGKRSPAELPYSLVLRERLRTIAKWKEGIFSYLFKIWDSEKRALKAVCDIESQFEQKTEVALYVEVNKTYAVKLPIDKIA